MTKILQNQTNSKSKHLDDIARWVGVGAGDVDFGRFARDLLDRAHEDVRDDGDAKKAGKICFNRDMLVDLLLYWCTHAPNIEVY